MQLGPVTKLDKRTSKKINDNIMSASCNVIIHLLIYAQFGVIRKNGL